MRLPHAVSTILMTVLTLLLYRSSAYSTSVAPSVDMSGWTQLPGAGLNVEDRNARVSEVRIERKSGIFNPGKYPRDEAEEKVVGRANVRGGFGPSVSDGSNFNSFPEPYPCAHSCLHGYCSPVTKKCVCDTGWAGPSCKKVFPDKASTVLMTPAITEGCFRAMNTLCPDYQLVFKHKCQQYVDIINKRRLFKSCQKRAIPMLTDVCNSRTNVDYFASCPGMCAAILQARCDEAARDEAARRLQRSTAGI